MNRYNFLRVWIVSLRKSPQSATIAGFALRHFFYYSVSISIADKPIFASPCFLTSRRRLDNQAPAPRLSWLCSRCP
jgi:hypothetical protein